MLSTYDQPEVATSSICVDEFMIVVGHIDQLQGNIFSTFQLHLAHEFGVKIPKLGLLWVYYG